MKLRITTLICSTILGVVALIHGINTTSPYIAQGIKQSSDNSCCTLEQSEYTATVQFAGFASHLEFRNEHEEPIPITFEGKGAIVTVKNAEGKECWGYEVKPPQAKTTSAKNVIFVIHEWWGLNDHIKREAEMLANDLNVRVIALDLYDGKVAASRDSAAKYMQSCSPDRAKSIISAFAGYVGADARIATVGWCFGGGWSHQASLLLGKQAVGCVIYYGMPETDPAKLANMNAPTLGIFAKQERWISPEVVAKFETAMKTAAKPLEIHSYDADHGFANPSNPKYNQKFTEEARTLVLAFFKKCFV
jgi:carboxymethylenebutenolidase